MNVFYIYEADYTHLTGGNDVERVSASVLSDDVLAITEVNLHYHQHQHHHHHHYHHRGNSYALFTAL